jgi:hypothetical protein
MLLERLVINDGFSFSPSYRLLTHDAEMGNATSAVQLGNATTRVTTASIAALGFIPFSPTYETDKSG